MIEAERAAGGAPDGTDAAALATVLLELNDRTLERLVRWAARSTATQLVEAVVAIWLRTIYGEVRRDETRQARRSPSSPSGVELRRLALHRRGRRRSTADAGRPVVVMAHGLGGTKDSGLEPFAEALAAAGLDVLAFDYRGFGASSGTAAPDGVDGRPGRGLPRRDGRGRPAARRRPAAARALGRLAGRRPRARRRGRPRRRRRGRRADAAGRRARRRPAARCEHHKPSAMLRSTAAGVRSRVSSRAAASR